MNKENNKPTKRAYIITIASLLIFGLIIWSIIYFIDIKIILLTLGIFSLLMYLNISITTLANAFIGRGEVNPNYDIFWKIVFMICSSISLGVYFNL